MDYCKVKKLIKKDINNICFALSNSNEYSLDENNMNLKIICEKAKILAGTFDKDIKYIINKDDVLVDLWEKAEKNNIIYTNILNYGKDNYLAVILLYFSAKYNSVFISNNIKTINCDEYFGTDFNLLEHRTSNNSITKTSELNSYKLTFSYKVDCHSYLQKLKWIVDYEFLQPEDIQQIFISACESSWVKIILEIIK